MFFFTQGAERREPESCPGHILLLPGYRLMADAVGGSCEVDGLDWLTDSCREVQVEP
jgi:hypothetical protein